MHQDDLIIRKPTKEDNLEKIAELLYNTDPYIYPYWFKTLDNCKKELSPLLLEDKFFFNINNLYISINKDNNDIVGVICIVNKNTDLDYDYSDLKAKNERYCFTIINYIEGLIKEVKESDLAYISNVCVAKKYRGKHIENIMLSYVIEIYKEKLFKSIDLDVLANNPGAIKLYQNLGFEQFTEIFSGFNNPKEEKTASFFDESKIKIV
ncbi:MAG: GNAT family N-acetyltransferase [Bacilli bacterium]|nr:GNAT family N-acetyltransferase [Bacilli bacterium]